MNKKIAVFTSASNNLPLHYYQLAQKCAELLHLNHFDLVYGGASIGMMGSMAQKMTELGGKVIGVIPQKIMDRELGYEMATELIISKGMHERKKIMYDQADAFIILPGGFGTLDEAFEVITWNQLGYHDKPVIFINYDGFYDFIKKYIDKAVTEKFVKNHDQFLPLFFDQLEDAIAWLSQ